MDDVTKLEDAVSTATSNVNAQAATIVEQTAAIDELEDTMSATASDLDAQAATIDHLPSDVADLNSTVVSQAVSILSLESRLSAPSPAPTTPSTPPCSHSKLPSTHKPPPSNPFSSASTIWTRAAHPPL
jgi:uncharacterized coiled-coil protein SlyX